MNCRRLVHGFKCLQVSLPHSTRFIASRHIQFNEWKFTGELAPYTRTVCTSVPYAILLFFFLLAASARKYFTNNFALLLSPPSPWSLYTNPCSRRRCRWCGARFVIVFVPLQQPPAVLPPTKRRLSTEVILCIHRANEDGDDGRQWRYRAVCVARKVAHTHNTPTTATMSAHFGRPAHSNRDDDTDPPAMYVIHSAIKQRKTHDYKSFDGISLALSHSLSRSVCTHRAQHLYPALSVLAVYFSPGLCTFLPVLFSWSNWNHVLFGCCFRMAVGGRQMLHRS